MTLPGDTKLEGTVSRGGLQLDLWRTVVMLRIRITEMRCN